MKKIPKIILILSFAPYVFLLLCGIYSAFAGFGFFFSTSYGFQGFMDSIFLMGFLLCWYPVLPSCLIYQLVYLFVFIMKKSNISGKRILLFSCAFALLLVIITLLIYINI